MRHVGMCAEETHTFIYIKNMAFGTGFDNNGEEQPKDQLQGISMQVQVEKLCCSRTTTLI